ncbi:MAG: transcription repressor NadR [Acidaminobacteraceae bacterium]
MTEKRRNSIIEILLNNELPITGTELAKEFEVSRQVIVQDVAVLRASGHNIIAASNGYFVPKLKASNLIYSFYSKHQGIDEIEDELVIIIENGGKIINVQVEHPVYGEIVCPLIINNRRELDLFLKRVNESSAKPLSDLTDGEHIHSIEVPDEKTYSIIIEKLKSKGYVE